MILFIGKVTWLLLFQIKNLKIHAYGPMKKTVIWKDQTIKRIEKTAKLKVIGIKRL